MSHVPLSFACLWQAKIANEYQWGIAAPRRHAPESNVDVDGDATKCSWPSARGRRSAVALGKNTYVCVLCLCLCVCIDIVFININVCKAPGPSPGSGTGPCPGTCAPDEILILFYLGFCLAEQNLREVNHTTLSILPISKDEENGIKTPSDCGSGRTLFGVVGASSTLLYGVTLDCFWLILMDLCSRLTHAHTHKHIHSYTDTPLNTYICTCSYRLTLVRGNKVATKNAIALPVEC